MLTFSNKTVVGTTSQSVKLTESDIENILVTGMEGGINYWAGLNNTGPSWEKKPKGEPNSTWATHLLLSGETVEFYDVEDEEETWPLTLEKVIKGYEKNATERPQDADIETGDAITADCIIQYALFDDVVYG